MAHGTFRGKHASGSTVYGVGSRVSRSQGHSRAVVKGGLRLIAGKRGKRNEKHFAHERLLRGAVGELLKTLMAFAQTFQEEIITVWEVERVTPHHAAMKKARKIETAIRRFAEHLQEDFRRHQAEGETSDDELAASVESLRRRGQLAEQKTPDYRQQPIRGRRSYKWIVTYRHDAGKQAQPLSSIAPRFRRCARSAFVLNAS